MIASFRDSKTPPTPMSDTHNSDVGENYIATVSEVECGCSVAIDAIDTTVRGQAQLHLKRPIRCNHIEDSDYESDESVSLEEALGIERACYMRAVITKGNLLNAVIGEETASEGETDEDEDPNEIEQEDSESEWSDEEILPVDMRCRCARNFPRRDDEFYTDDSGLTDVEGDNL